MRLTTVLLRFKHPHGHLYHGKHRLRKAVTDKSFRALRWDYEIEEQNMLLLRHPYLTIEQSSGHMKDLRVDQIAKWDKERSEKFSKITTLEDRLMHLKVRDAWD
ncbi:large ribosomal subunit protein mL63 [Neodiprion pinetum]|uniref:Ribosomal protein 63, mitochondrial n=1 Tax=Neodiprion lecontei TaxID=441921 RepID=A0A6J0BFM9_NEOLC|nr:ribosomal protein 63, mitochondrial [Neodiprion lecontei]XP_046471072.1 ribosomal protein 63, mitochondrial [Neodiprion pinetum]